MTPRLSYFVCATPRSGTQLLTGLLKSTELAGRPEEYFWRGGTPFWGELPLLEYLDDARTAGTTPNGTFGAKVMWGYFPDLLAALGTIGARLETVFPRLHFVWLRREDVVAQAVSHLKAIQTQIWYAGDTRSPGGELRFDIAVLDHLVAEIDEHNRGWDDWFARNAARPLRLTYEYVAAEPLRATNEVLEFLGLPPVAKVEVQTRLQADELSAEWVARYRSLRGAR